MNEVFRRFAANTSHVLGSPWAFLAALLTIFVWALMGPLARYSETWQLIINTGTTIVTFLMVFLIQNTQNRDVRSLQLKLDELIKSTGHARNAMVDLEDLSDDELDRLEKEFSRMRERAKKTKDEKGESKGSKGK